MANGSGNKADPADSRVTSLKIANELDRRFVQTTVEWNDANLFATHSVGVEPSSAGTWTTNHQSTLTRMGMSVVIALRLKMLKAHTWTVGLDVSLVTR
jgi:hypothetical protein